MTPGSRPRPAAEAEQKNPVTRPPVVDQKAIGIEHIVVQPIAGRQPHHLQKLLLESGPRTDPTDRASLESDRNFELRIRDRERKLIGKIREAIERIDDGTYGQCESCEEEIGLARLKVRPVTTMCIDCKTEQERQEKIG